MKVQGMIKAIQASIAAGGADVTQVLKIEIFGDEWHDLRGFMQKPLEITIEQSQMEFGKDSPMKEGSIETTAKNGKRSKIAAES
ncbi:MAG: hypothetical protein UMS36scaffold28_50 [Phage 59_13]|nr:MAG: hypothetical protein UMS36scaffold28_50 [Phage 59_13]